MVIRTSTTTTATTATQWPALIPTGPLAGKPPIPLARAATLIGTRHTANLRLHSSQVSKAHALVLSSQGTVHIRDLNSRTKVFVNGRAIRAADLKEGDQIKIGRYTFRFTAGPRIQSSRKRQLPGAQLETDAGDVVALGQRVIVIGQREGSDLVLAGETVSTTHAAIFDVNGRRYIMDLGSRNGTLVNNQKTLQVELKVGDVIDIGGTEVRYVAAAGAAEPTSVPAAAPVAAASADADIDELIAIESLSEPLAPHKPSGKSTIFEPPPMEDSNAPLPLEDGPSLPAPLEPARVDDARIVLEPESAPEPEIAPEPIAAQKSSDDLAAEKAAEDELMALLEEEPAEPPVAQPEPVALSRERAEDVAIPLEEPQPAPEPEPVPVERPRIEINDAAEPPPALPILKEISQSEPEEEPIPIDIEPEPPLAIEPKALPVEEAPIEEPLALAIEEAAPPEPLVEESAIQVEEPSHTEAIAPEPQSLLDETPEPEPAEPESLVEEAPEPPPIAVEPETLPTQEQPQELAAVEDEVADLPVEEPKPEEPVAAEVEAIAPPMPEELLDIELESEIASQPPAVATTNVDLIPDAVEEVTLENQEAAAAFPTAELPAIPPPQTPEPESKIVPPPLPEEPAEQELKIEEPTALAPEPELNLAAPPLPEEPVEEEPKVEEPISAAPPEPLPIVDELNQTPTAEEPDIDDWLQEEPAAPEPKPAAVAPIELAPPPPADETPAPAATQTPAPAPIEEAPLPLASQTPAPPAPAAPQEPPPAPVAAPTPPPPVAPTSPPRPRWFTTPIDPKKQAAPTVLRINPDAVPNFSLDELLGEKPKQAVAPVLPRVPESAPKPPVTEPPQATDSLELPPTPPAPIEPAPAPIAEASAPQAPPDEPDLDDLALAALEESAPAPAPAPEPAATAPPAPPPVAPPAPPAPPSFATTNIATVTVDDDLEEDLLEPFPDEPESAPQSIPVAQVGSNPSITSRPPPARATGATVAETFPDPTARDVFSLSAATSGIETEFQSGPSVPITPMRSPGRITPRAGRLSPPIPPRWAPVPTPAAPAFGDVATPSHHQSPRRGRKRLSLLLALMAVAMVLAAFAVWKFVLPRVVVQGTIQYDGFNQLMGDSRESYKQRQVALMTDGKVRSAAEVLFRKRQSASAGFFADDDLRSPQLVREWLTSDGGQTSLQITYNGSDPALDDDRLTCLLQAIYEANNPSVSAADAAFKNIEQKRVASTAAKAALAKLRDRKQDLLALVRPDSAELSAMQAAVDKLDAAWTNAIAARKAIAADVDRLQQPAEAAATGSAADGDSSLRTLTEKLTELNGRLAEAKSSAAKQAADARKSLNASIDEFQTSLAVAQGMMKDNPALATYISSAQKLHEASWKLQGDLIERQERQQKQLLEYKKRLEEQVEVRRREVVEKDPDLKELNHLLDLKTREVNALSASGGLKRDVERLRSEMQYIEGRIQSRKAALSEDKFYSDAIGGLKQIIDSVQKQLDADRAASEKLMNDLETKFRNTSPEIETLPAAQRSLAARLGGHVDAMQAARKSYGDAVQAQDADANARLKELQAQAAALESEIALRRKEVSAEQHKKLTEQQAGDLRKKQTQLAAAEKAELAAREAYRQKIRELDQLAERERAWQSTREELTRINQIDEPARQDDLLAAERALAAAQRAAAGAAAPQPPAPARMLEMHDYRAFWVTGAVLAIGLIFGSLIFFTAHSEPRHRHAPANGAPVEENTISV